ncbi:S1 RNA-binding domain-containing protein [Candidatus Gottesmanbacteria bacterium]|nr:S1 RNA-binding domain-containing protein [Candidatus Gottesmanbacteria bacterium]
MASSSKIKDQKLNIKDKGKKIKAKDEKASPSVVETSAKKPANEPQTMEELLKNVGYTLRGVKKGDVLEGKITSVSPKEITIDIGGKAEGVIIDRELETYKDMLMALKPGDSVVAQVIVAENDRGQSVLSLRRSIFEKRWTTLTDAAKSGEPVEIIMKDPVRGGVLVEYGGLRGYIPQSQLDATLSKQMDKISGRRVMAKVLEVDKETNRLIFSQRALSEEATLSKQKDLLDLLKEGETVQATITGVVPFGAFAKIVVDKDGEKLDIEGLIHISEIAWEKVEDPHQYLKVGDGMKVKIVGVDSQTGKLTLSLKQLLPDPWEHVLDLFEKDTQVKGTVSRVSPYGIFVTLSPGIEGLIHISKVSPGEEPKAGDELTLTIEDIQPEKRKISLSVALTEKPIGYR